MKTKIDKKPVKRANRKVEPAPDSATVICDGSVKVLALECWRIQKLIPEFVGNRKHLVDCRIETNSIWVTSNEVCLLLPRRSR
jgi:hypothetical protein